jgi:hypothetical protein
MRCHVCDMEETNNETQQQHIRIRDVAKWKPRIEGCLNCINIFVDLYIQDLALILLEKVA